MTTSGWLASSLSRSRPCPCLVLQVVTSEAEAGWLAVVVAEDEAVWLAVVVMEDETRTW